MRPAAQGQRHQRPPVVERDPSGAARVRPVAASGRRQRAVRRRIRRPGPEPRSSSTASSGSEPGRAGADRATIQRGSPARRSRTAPGDVRALPHGATVSAPLGSLRDLPQSWHEAIPPRRAGRSGTASTATTPGRSATTTTGTGTGGGRGARPPGLRGDRGAKGRHQLVEPAHHRPPPRLGPALHPQGAALLRPLRGRSLRTGRHRRLPAWFPRLVGTIAGEWTPDYFYYPWVPALLAEAAPAAKLLLILRDPVQRFRSGLAHQIRNGADHVGSTQAEAIGRSLYSDALRRWRACFPAEQLLIMLYEECVAEPGKQLARTYEYLGLDPDFQPADIAGPAEPDGRGQGRPARRRAGPPGGHLPPRHRRAGRPGAGPRPRAVAHRQADRRLSPSGRQPVDEGRVTTDIGCTGRRCPRL